MMFIVFRIIYVRYFSLATKTKRYSKDYEKDIVS